MAKSKKGLMPEAGEWWIVHNSNDVGLANKRKYVLVAPERPRVKEYESQEFYDTSVPIRHMVGLDSVSPAARLNIENFYQIAGDSDVRAIQMLFGFLS